MSTRFIRKRSRRKLPIGYARLREAHLTHGKNRQHRLINYPLYESYKTIYNYDNLHESIKNWDAYSNDTKRNLKQMVNLLNEMIEHDKFEQRWYDTARVICEDILPYLENPTQYKNILFETKDWKLRDKIMEKINDLKEYDRINENYKILSESINMPQYFMFYYRNELPLNEAINDICDNCSSGELGLDYCVMIESVLYALDEVFPRVDERAVVETITDYYLERYNTDIPKFLETIRECARVDDFLPDAVLDYADYIEYVNSDRDLLAESTIQHFDEKKKYDLLGEDYQDLMKVSYYEALNEFEIIDKAKEIITKFKSIPNKSIANIKEAINALFVSRRLQDIKKNTHNALSLIFYTVCGMGVGIAVNFAIVPSIILGFLTSVILSKAVNKEYLQDSIKAWREHKYAVQQKMKHAKSEDKAKLMQYIEEVDKNIEILEKEYDEVRDRTNGELRDQAYKNAMSKHYGSDDDITNPLGDNPLNHNNKEGDNEENE